MSFELRITSRFTDYQMGIVNTPFGKVYTVGARACTTPITQTDNMPQYSTVPVLFNYAHHERQLILFQISTPFEPFEAQAWLFIVSVSLYMAIAMQIIHKYHAVPWGSGSRNITFY